MEQCPVRFAGVEQGSDAVVVEVGEPEGGAFDAFDQVVGCFGGGVGDSGGVPVGDLGSPGGDGDLCLRKTRRVAEELTNSCRLLGVVVVVV